MKNDALQIAQDWPKLMLMEVDESRYYFPVRAHNPKVEGSDPSPLIIFIYVAA